jgi:hypothetical protein
MKATSSTQEKFGRKAEIDKENDGRGIFILMSFLILADPLSFRVKLDQGLGTSFNLKTQTEFELALVGKVEITGQQW